MENIKDLSLADLREYRGGNTVLKLTQNSCLYQATSFILFEK